MKLFFSFSGTPGDLHSFPTRRSSDLQQAAIVVTHDRAFLDRVCTRILELDRGMLRSYPGNYSAYETLKAADLAAEATAQRVRKVTRLELQSQSNLVCRLLLEKKKRRR